jgi:coproporphyrinogen III oxidase-like Fe-S oxidoreductase
MESMQGLLDVGVNRISLGIQSFNSSILQSMGRHAPDNSLPFIMNGLSKCRPPNLNVDFILNFCSSSTEWEEMIEFIKQVLP